MIPVLLASARRNPRRWLAPAWLAVGIALSGWSTAYAQTGATLTTVHRFSAPNPVAALLQAADGNFYGVTPAGGVNGYGSVFQYTSAGTLTTLYSFGGGDGSNPRAALIQAADGNFYGATTTGGAYGRGTIFQLSPVGTLTTLHSFTGPDGSGPAAALLQGTDGNFYGTTASGGASGYGTVFQLAPSGVLITLHSFAGVADGSGPAATLIQGTDGNFYGTTVSSGPGGYGTIFQMTSAGVLTTLHGFNRTDGSGPSALVQAVDGNFYGTTSAGGSITSGRFSGLMPPVCWLRSIPSFITKAPSLPRWSRLPTATSTGRRLSANSTPPARFSRSLPRAR